MDDLVEKTRKNLIGICNRLSGSINNGRGPDYRLVEQFLSGYKDKYEKYDASDGYKMLVMFGNIMNRLHVGRFYSLR